jgi:ADP-ribosyl-[dinitrogen reductase] hydrolase
MPFEQKEHTDPELAAWDGSFQPCPESHPFCKGLRPGQWTDDTKMALALSQSMLRARTYSPAGAAEAYVTWYRSNDWRGIGTATQAAMSELARGSTMWANSGVPGAEGNGTAMRIAPLGLYMRKYGDAVVAECARLDAGITHNSLEAREGAVIVALCVSHLAAGNPREDMIKAVSMGGHVRGCATLGRLKEVDHYVAQMENVELSTAVSIAAKVLKTGGHVVETVPAAIFCFLATSSFSEAVELAVRAGGDSDTTAAVAGAIAGTHYRSEGTVQYWRELEGAQLLVSMDEDLNRGP